MRRVQSAVTRASGEMSSGRKSLPPNRLTGQTPTRPTPRPPVHPAPAAAWLLTAALAVLLTATGLAGAQVGQAPAATPAEALIAHRGYSALAPENTLTAFRAAAEAGLPRVWTEVRTTADGALVLLADASLERTTDCQGAIREQTLAALAACEAGAWFDARFAGETLPTLERALAEPGLAWWLYLADASPEASLAAVRAAGAADAVAYVTEREADVAALQAADPSAEVWLRVNSLSAGAIALGRESGATGLAANAASLRAADLANAAAAGLAVLGVEVGEDPALLRALSDGVHYLSTPRVEAALRILNTSFRSYLPTDLGRPMIEGQGFVSALAGGDFNGDGRADLVLGAPLDDSAGEAAGWVGVLSGADRFPGPLWQSAGSEAEARWGAVFAVADFNADGFDDLAIGYPLRDFGGGDSGAVWLLDGAPNGLGGLSRPIGSQAPAASRMGAALASGDFNGDGVSDLAIAAPGRAVGNQAGAGQVTIMPGLAGSGPVATGALVLDRSTERQSPPVAMPGNPTRGEALGTALVAGDFDGNGTSDLAIGVPNADAGELRGAGTVLLAWLEADSEGGGPVLRAAQELPRGAAPVPGPGERASRFGAALATADFDADGHDDLVIGAPEATVAGRRGAGEVLVLYGAPAGFDPGRSLILNQDTPLIPGAGANRGGFGEYLVVGDLDGDGYPDLAIGSPAEIVAGQPAVGAVTVIYGGPEGLRPRLALRFEPGLAMTGFPAGARQAFGQALAIADLNHDGQTDLAIGVPGLMGGGRAVGGLVVGWGAAAGLPGVATPTPPPATPTPTATETRIPTSTRTPTQGPSATPSPTPRPPQDVYLPYAARLKRPDPR